MVVKFLKSAGLPQDYPFPYKPEVAIVGRSNAGKSSFINAFTSQKIAKVSQTPGKTRLLQFFDLDGKVYMVDMPGYGYATGDRREVESWREMIEVYLKERKTLKGVLLVMDIRREWSEEEDMLKRWFEYHGTSWALLLNKADKLSRSQTLKAVNGIKKHTGQIPLYAVSSAKKTGLEEVKNLVMKGWTK